MFVLHFNSRRYKFKQIIFLILFILFRWKQRIHFYIFFITLFIASVISYRQPSSLLFNIRYLKLKLTSTEPYRNQLINQQKEEQKLAYEWLENILKNLKNYPDIISNQTQQSNFYNYLHIINSSYTLLNKPKQVSINTTNHIVISILYGKQDTDHREGKFYIGELLYQLLKNFHSRFIITLCENDNTNEKASDGIQLIRQLFPVFLVNSQSTDNTFEREKQAHLKCILANFQSFPNINYLLLLQDDAKPISNDFSYQLSSLIDYRIQNQWPLNGHRQHPAFIKIYHPRWLVGYLHPSFYTITQFIATSILLSFIFFICFYFCQTIIYKKQLKWQYYSKSTLHSNANTQNISLVHVLIYSILINLVLILIDHTNTSWTWRSLHPSLYAIYPAPSCCLPGVLYFRQTYIQVTDYLNSIKCHSKYAIDTAFDDLPKRTHLQTFLVEPNLVHHIGLYSRLRQMYINPYLID